MPRQQIPAGQLGTVQFAPLADGRVRARARMRDAAGELIQLRAIGATPDEALARLKTRARKHSIGTDEVELTTENTIADACRFWLGRVHTATLAPSTIASYESTVRTIVLPACGGVELGTLTVGRCDRIIHGVLLSRSASAARRVRSVLNQVCATVVRQDVLPFNPMRDISRLPLPAKKQSYLTPAQLMVLRTLIRAWRLQGTKRFGPRPDVVKLEDAMDIMVGTSARIGELLALRRCDVEVTGTPPTVLIGATLTYTRATGLIRKPTPKRSRQTRKVALPAKAAEAVRRRLALAGTDAGAWLFPTTSGRPYSVSNFERLLRTFGKENTIALSAAGIEAAELTSHIFRRTAATLVEAVGGITLASRPLGHANEATTRANYVVTIETVNPTTAAILDEALGVG